MRQERARDKTGGKKETRIQDDSYHLKGNKNKQYYYSIHIAWKKYLHISKNERINFYEETNQLFQ